MFEKKLRIDSEKKETPIHILKGFPIGILTSRFTKDTYHFVNWHWHEELQYNVVLEGAFDFYVADKKYRVKVGDGLFINGHQIHKAEAVEPNSTFAFIYFHPKLLTSQKDSYFYKNYVSTILSDNFVGSILLNRKNEDDRRIIDTVLEIKHINNEKNDLYELDILSSLIQLWKCTLSCAQNKSLIQANHDNLTNNRLKDIIAYIDDHYSGHLALDDIANHVYLSRSECCRFFKNAIGQSLFQYILHYRINKSVELLTNTDKSIAIIAHEVGFNGQSYFTKCFTSIKNKTPKQFRNEYKNKQLETEYLDGIDNSVWL